MINICVVLLFSSVSVRWQGVAAAASADCAAGCPNDPLGCPGDLCCSLNGKLQPDGQCKCQRPWSGPRCATMETLPVSFPQGYGMKPNLTSWGISVLFDGSHYHAYVATMTNHCPLSLWQSNSRIDYAISPTITGPYEFSDVAVNTWSHNPAVLRLPDGSFALFHIGEGSGSRDGGSNCNNSLGLQAPQGSTIHISNSMNGSWTPLLTNTLGYCNNPSPWVHSNGTIFVLCSGGGDGLKRADNISGPWTVVTTVFTAAGGLWGIYEDPFLYMDADDNFHLLFHVYNTDEPGETCTNSTVSAHVFSHDGFAWHTTPIQPFTTEVKLSSGGAMTVATRERPKLFFDSSGRPTHLFNGVSAAASCWPSSGGGLGDKCVNCKFKGWTFTLVTPLDVEEQEPSAEGAELYL